MQVGEDSTRWREAPLAGDLGELVFCWSGAVGSCARWSSLVVLGHCGDLGRPGDFERSPDVILSVLGAHTLHTEQPRFTVGDG